MTRSLATFGDSMVLPAELLYTDKQVKGLRRPENEKKRRNHSRPKKYAAPPLLCHIYCAVLKVYQKMLF